MRRWVTPAGNAASGLPTPHRRTFAAPILGSALSGLPALRHPWLRWSATPAPGAWAAPRQSMLALRMDAPLVTPEPRFGSLAIGCSRYAGRVALEARGVSRGNAGLPRVERRVFPHLTIRASRQPGTTAPLAWRASHRIQAAPWLRLRMRKPAGAMDGLSFAPAHPFGPASSDARLAWRASHRRSRHTVLCLRPAKAARAMDGRAAV